MPPNETLLDYLSGGRYQTSQDIPPLIGGPRMSQEEMLTTLSGLNQFLNPPLPENVQAPGLGLLEWADTGPLVGMKALAGLVGKGGKKVWDITRLNKWYAKHMKDVAKYDPYGNRKALDAMLSKYGTKAHSHIRRLVDENRAIAMDLPERAMPMETAIKRMIRTVEPNTKKADDLVQTWQAEEWVDFIIPHIIAPLKGQGF